MSEQEVEAIGIKYCLGRCLALPCIVAFFIIKFAKLFLFRLSNGTDLMVAVSWGVREEDMRSAVI
jgi:hypothetical protein